MKTPSYEPDGRLGPPTATANRRKKGKEKRKKRGIERGMWREAGMKSSDWLLCVNGGVIRATLDGGWSATCRLYGRLAGSARIVSSKDLKYLHVSGRRNQLTNLVVRRCPDY